MTQVESAYARSLSSVAETLGGPLDIDELLELICLAAVDSVPGADHAGITLSDRRGGLRTRGATDEVVRKADALQYSLAEGPCVDAVEGRWQARADDLRTDVRWPEYGPRAAALGILSQMGIELFDEPGMIAGLNLYASRPGAFDDDTVEAVMMFAIQAAHTLGRVMTQKQLTDAMVTRTTIGRATGVVMERFQFTAARAFELLTRMSRLDDVTMEEVAARILEELDASGQHR